MTEQWASRLLSTTLFTAFDPDVIEQCAYKTEALGSGAGNPIFPMSFHLFRFTHSRMDRNASNITARNHTGIGPYVIAFDFHRHCVGQATKGHERNINGFLNSHFDNNRVRLCVCQQKRCQRERARATMKWMKRNEMKYIRADPLNDNWENVLNAGNRWHFTFRYEVNGFSHELVPTAHRPHGARCISDMIQPNLIQITRSRIPWNWNRMVIVDTNRYGRSISNSNRSLSFQAQFDDIVFRRLSSTSTGYNFEKV